MRYGKLKTAFRHFTIIADGEIATSNPDYGTTAGAAAFFSMKAWALDSEQAADMVVTIGQHLGFESTGEIQLYDTDPEEPPGEKPRAYNLNFHQYSREKEHLQ
ncbi:hypothetical protein OIU34_26760 [Pararhizobium sp. BT-229]|uniref:hypothetical protein n=1 Tax=Pararhizobium sp. BT-229 TaxID=2986923 RepID=UPI0021F77AC7|nr:hypothetical protein [Pararhizobium sp. BT-229]MCV9965484.1 hypothetical protein [Pararhizobium sp. BT-229]